MTPFYSIIAVYVLYLLVMCGFIYIFKAEARLHNRDIKRRLEDIRYGKRN